MPSRVRDRIRAASNSAKADNVLNINLPTGLSGAYVVPSKVSATPRLDRSSAMSFASRIDRAADRAS
jgi:hypothetical protein